MATIKFDTSDLKKGVAHLEKTMTTGVDQAVDDVANEALRLSQQEVPHDTGQLQNTGHVEKERKNERVVGYNKVYAAKLHEHPEYIFQNGRKGKYLEDPIKRNLTIFRNYITKTLSSYLTK